MTAYAEVKQKKNNNTAFIPVFIQVTVTLFSVTCVARTL